MLSVVAARVISQGTFRAEDFKLGYKLPPSEMQLQDLALGSQIYHIAVGSKVSDCWHVALLKFGVSSTLSRGKRYDYQTKKQNKHHKKVSVG